MTTEQRVADSEGRVATTEERVSYIEGALPELARRSDVAGIRIEMADFRTEVKTEMADFRTEVKTEMADVKADVAVLSGRMDRVEQDVKEIKVSVDKLEARVAETETRLIRWMIGIGALIVGALAVLQMFFN